MKLKDRIKTYNFWVSLSSAIFLIIKVLGNQVGFKVDENLFSDLITSLCSILVILGIIVPPTKTQNKSSNQLNDNSLEYSNSTNDDCLNTKQLETNQILSDSLNYTDNSQELNSISSDILTESSNTNNIESNEKVEKSIFNNTIIENHNVCSNEIFEQTENNNEPEKSIIKNEDKINNITETNSSNQFEFTKSKFQNQLKIQENLFANNIEEYIKILEIELESLKNK